MRPEASRNLLRVIAGVGVLWGFGVGGMALSSPGPPALLAAVDSPRGTALPASHTLFRDGPPARVTGGFGEDSCFACHWDGIENDDVGRLEVDGFPEVYEPGAVHELEVRLVHPDLVVAGFQLAIRSHDGESQVGSLEPVREDEEALDIVEDRSVQFAQHTLIGIAPSGEGETRWTVRWVAPEEGSGTPALLHIAAVSGDGDESQMGDAVYTLELESLPTEKRQAPE